METKTLHNANGLPVAAFTLGNVSKGLKSGEKGYAFGGDKHKIVAAMRALADAIEQDEVIVQNVVLSQKTSIDEFEYHTLAVEYAVQRVAE